MKYLHYYESPLGRITVASDGAAVTGLWFEGQKYYGAGIPDSAMEEERPEFHRVDLWLDRYFAGEDPGTDPGAVPPLAPKGTPFQRSVWQILRAIPYGETVTYGEIAGQIARKRGLASMSAQAVGSAVGRNPISILIPCHRVIGADGRLTGYAGGLWRKEALLRLEQGQPAHFKK